MIVELMEIDVYLVDTLKELAIQTAHAYILIYSFENPVESFEYISKVKQEIDELKGDGMPMVLVSNKADTPHGQVTQTSKQSGVYVWGLPHTEISLTTGMNIGEVYRHLFTHPILQRMIDVVSLINASSVTSCVRRMSLPAFHVQERRSFTCIKEPSEVLRETLSENTPETKRQFPETPTLRKQPTSKWSKFQRFFARLKVRK
jgi:GTPase SAR1 family protein